MYKGINANGLVFNEKEHKYTLDGIPIPSVSAILNNIPKADFLRDNYFWSSDDGNKSMHQSAAMGTIAHNALEAFSLGESEEAILKNAKILDDELRENFIEFEVEYEFENGRKCKKKYPFISAIPKISAGLDFIKNSGYKVIGVEVATANRELWYSGTFDLMLEKDGKKYIGDYKTSRYSKNEKQNLEKAKKYGIQMSAYELSVLESMDIEVCGRFVVWLLDGQYKLYHTDDYTKIVRRLCAIQKDDVLREVIREYNSGSDDSILNVKYIEKTIFK